MKRVYIIIDNFRLKILNNNKEKSFTSLFTVDASNLCKRIEIGRYFRTGGTKAILKYIKLNTIELWGTKEKEKNVRKATIRLGEIGEMA